jgi:hypothetical protein
MREERNTCNEAVSLDEFNDLKLKVANITRRLEAVEKRVRTRNPNEQIKTIKVYNGTLKLSNSTYVSTTRTI